MEVDTQAAQSDKAKYQVKFRKMLYFCISVLYCNDFHHCLELFFTLTYFSSVGGEDGGPVIVLIS